MNGNRTAALFLAFGMAIGETSAIADPDSAKPVARGFDIAVDKLPANFKGPSPVAILEALGKKSPPVKGEFETTEQYTARKQAWEAVPLLPGVWINAPLVLSFPARLRDQIDTTYDADKETMTVTFTPSCGLGNQLEILSENKKTGSYIGSNAFGVKKIITKATVTRLCLTVTDQILDRRPIRDRGFRVARSLAPAIKAQLRVLVVGRLVAPYSSFFDPHFEPTINSPYDVQEKTYVLQFAVAQVWLYDGVTGEIYDRPKPPTREERANVRDGEGNNELMQDILSSRTEDVIALIKSHAVEVNSQNNNNETALHLAVARRNVPVVRALIEAGASKDLWNSNHQTPISRAQDIGDPDILEALRDR